MADIEYAQDPVGPVSLGGAISKGASLGGAVLSLGIIVGIGIWGYQLVARDVSGVPVVRALEGPMRIQPKDPGGIQADHQGLAVNDVAARGSATAPADRLVLAPRPIDLRDEDVPLTAGATEVSAASGPVTQSPEPAAPADAKPVVMATNVSVVDALVDQLMAAAEPMEPLIQLTDEQQVPVEIVQPTPLIAAIPDIPLPETAPEVLNTSKPIVVVTGPGLTRSLRPQLRPQNAALTGPAPTAETASLILGPLDVDADTLPAGTRLAQLGAYDSAEVARSEWDRLNGQFGDYMDDKKRVIQKASSGGRTFYRLRAMGFDDLSDARRFCTVLIADKADCIPVTTR